MANLNKTYLKDIKEVITTNTKFNDNSVEVTITCWLNYGIEETYTVARIYDKYAITYIAGIEKEYKRRKSAINAILRVYNTIAEFDRIMEFKAVKIENSEEIEETKNNIIKEDIKEYYTVGNICFNNYSEAYDYCNINDFDPDLMIIKNAEGVGISPASANNIFKLSSKKVINLKIKLLDNKIDRLLDKRFILKNEIKKNGIKFNNRDNELIKELNSYDSELDSLELKIDSLKEEYRVLNNKQYKEYVNALKEEYIDNKYKVIDNKNGSIMYTNNLKDYLYNKNYTIKLILDNKEVFKQYINNKNELYGNSLNIIKFKNNDTTNNTVKKEIYCLNTNKLLYIELNKTKGNNDLTYVKNNIFNNRYLSFNYKEIRDLNTLNKVAEVFKNDKEVIDILDKYVIKNCKNTNIVNRDLLAVAIKDYTTIINKFNNLKKVCDNIEYYNSLYKSNIKAFYKKYKTNAENWSNYLSNYRYLEYLNKNKDNIKDYKYKSPKKVVYTTKYRKYLINYKI